MELHLTYHKNNASNKQNKMDGMVSLNFLGPIVENRCYFRSKCAGSVCNKCYSLKLTKTYLKLKERMKENYLKTLNWKGELPFLNLAFLRVSAFGELEDLNHFSFIISLVRANPHCLVTMWTKEKDIVFDYFSAGQKKPENLILIYSSFFLNNKEDLPPYFDKVFTAYTVQYARDNKIKINCGLRQCKKCRLCYSKNKVVHISEFEKNEASAQKARKKRAKNKMKA